MNPKFSIRLGSKNYKINIREKPKAHLEIQVNNYIFEFPPRKFRNLVKKVINSYPLDKDYSEILEIKSPLPGIIGDLFTSSNDQVKKNQVLGIVLSMKMENEIYSPVNGKIIKILVKEKQQVKKNDLLFLIAH